MKKTCLLALLFLTALVSTVTAQTVSLKGRVIDPQAAVVVGADVVVKNGDNIVAQGKSGPQGTFDIPVPPGQYTVLVDADGFALLTTPNVRVAANTAQMTFSVKVAQATQEVTVQEDASLISLDPSSNLTATVLDQEFIDQLPDDPDDLSAYLSDLAGPRANATGGLDFIIDGFSNGVLPPKEQILQIRINNNPFSTEFMRPGYGRIEIVTKPGTGVFHGNAQFNMRDQALDANSFVSFPGGPAVPEKAPYQRRNYILGLNGPIVKGRATISLNGTREDDDPSYALTGTNPLNNTPESGFVTSTSLRESYNARGQWGLTNDQRHIMNFNLLYGSRNQQNQGVGGIQLPTSPALEAAGIGSNAYGVTNNNEEVQLREMEIISASLIHEMRVEWDRNVSNTLPYTLNGPTFTITDVAQFGSANNLQQSKNTTTQFANALSYTTKILTLKAGLQAEKFNQYQFSQNNFNGSYTFPTFAAYQAQTPNLFTLTSGIPAIQVTEWTFAPYIQTEWKLTKKLVFSPGVRYQIQTNLNDHNDIDPRMSFAYQMTPTIVARGGFGIFHQTLSAGTVQTLIQNDGTHQLNTVITNENGPITYPVNPATASLLGSASEIYIKAPDLRTPYTVNTGVSLEKAFKNGLSVTGSFDDIKSVHLFRGRDINFPTMFTYPTLGSPIQPVGPRPVSGVGIVDQLESSGDARFDSLTLGMRQRIGNLNMFANYTYSKSYNDTNGPFSLPLNSYNLRAEWALAGNNVPNRLQTTINYRITGMHHMLTTWTNGIVASTNIVAQSGHPYSQMISNPNPDGASWRLAGVGRDTLVGPGSLNIGLNLNKVIVLRESKAAATQRAQQQGGGGPRGGGGFGNVGGGGGRGGPGGGGPGGGGFGGGPGGGAPAGMTMTFFGMATNVINKTNLGTPTGTEGTIDANGNLIPDLRYGISTTKGAQRIIDLGVRFNF